MKNTLYMNIEKELELLKGIRKVDASPFLYTRIEQNIKNYQENYFGKKTLAVYFAVLSIIIVVNISVVIAYFSYSAKNNTELIIKNFNLIKSNNLYE